MSTTLFLLNCYVSSPRGVILKLEHISGSQEGLIKAQNSGPYLYKLIFSRIGVGLLLLIIICASNKFLGDTIGPRIIFENHRPGLQCLR